jgi:two-component system chemotaxis response regulator CheY
MCAQPRPPLDAASAKPKPTEREIDDEIARTVTRARDDREKGQPDTVEAGTSRPQDVCRVLIVEDDPDLREMMCLLLAHEGFEPAAARDGLEALDLLRSHKVEPAVIVLDIMMPRMDGEQFLREQAVDPSIRDIPVVLLTAAPCEQLDVNAAAILRKPCDYDALVSAIRTHCAAPRRRP